MSFFLLYFETKNKESTYYAGFSDVGRFQIPQKMFAGNVLIFFEGIQYVASLISDESKQCANDFFFKEEVELRIELFNFIEKRFSNGCVISHLGGYIESNKNETVLMDKIKSIRYDVLKEIFSRDIFAHGYCLEINK